MFPCVLLPFCSVIHQSATHLIQIPTLLLQHMLLTHHCLINHTMMLASIGDELIEIDLYDLYRKRMVNLTPLNIFSSVQISYEQSLNTAKPTGNRKFKNENRTQGIKNYETIVFGRSQAGQMVRTSMGTSSVANKIIEDLRTLFSTYRAGWQLLFV